MKTLSIIPLVLIAGLLFGCESESLVATNSNLDQIASVQTQSITADAKQTPNLLLIYTISLPAT